MPAFADHQPGRRRPTTTTTVRPATAADLGAMGRVQRRAGRDPHRDSWAQAIADHDRCVVVACTSGPDGADVVVGWAQTHHHTVVQDTAPAGHYLGGVTVDVDHRRRGVALALTQVRMEWLWERAVEAWYVVNPANAASIDLHRRWGFQEVLRADRLTGVTFDGGVGILMRATRPRAG